MKNSEFYLPSEWQAQSAILLTWPHKNTDWQANLAAIEQVYVELTKAITRFQLVVITCHDKELEADVMTKLIEAQVNPSAIRTFIAPCNDTWARDHGPITLINKTQQNKVMDFTFNAWGDKYHSSFDNDINSALSKAPFFHAEHYEASDFILEGGSIESDGNGTLLTTTRCLLNKNRNAELSKSDIESTLLTVLGMEQVHWLEHGFLQGDDTDAHIDTLARFTPNGIAYVACDDPSDPHFEELQKMAQQLAVLKDVNGEPYKLYPLPMPNEVINDDNERLPATYANFLILNGAVLVPVYNDEHDQHALNTLQRACPDHEVIGIDCRAVIEQFGSLHCLTMQLPANLIK